MKLSTSSFWKCGKNPRAVSIARQVPQLFRGPTFWPLVPSWGQLSRFRERVALMGMEEANGQFVKGYRQQLADLNPRKIAAELGDCAVMLCWEHNPANPQTPCHRTVVAEWLRTVGIEVTEVECHSPVNLGNPRPTRQLRLDFDNGEV